MARPAFANAPLVLADDRGRLAERDRPPGGGAPLDEAVTVEDDRQLRAATQEIPERRGTSLDHFRVGLFRRHTPALAVGAVATALTSVGRPAVAGRLLVEAVDRPDSPAAATGLLRGRRRRGSGRWRRRSGRRPGVPTPAGPDRCQQDRAQGQMPHPREHTPSVANQDAAPEPRCSR